MIYKESVWDEKENTWTPTNNGQYKNTSVGQFCKRVTNRLGVRSEYTYALKKHGTVIIPWNDKKIKMELTMEEKDVGHKFTGETVDFTATGIPKPNTGSSASESGSEGDQVHAGRRDDSSHEQSADVAANSEVHSSGGDESPAREGHDGHSDVHSGDQEARAEA